MKRILILIIGLIGVAYGQSSPTSAKTRFVNGIYLGTKLDAYFNAADSNAIYWRADSVVMAKYKGTARALAFAVSGGYIPYSDTTSLFSQVVRTFGTQTVGGNKTFSNDIVVNGSSGVTVGRGNNAVVSNTVVGFNSLSSITSGAGNTAIGNNNLSSTTTASNNVSVGNNGLQNNITGGANSVFGSSALTNNTDGSNNIAIGQEAARFALSSGSTPLTSVNNSTYIGFQSRASAATGVSNETVIGYGQVGNGSNTVTIGNSSVTDNYFTGNVRGGALILTGNASGSEANFGFFTNPTPANSVSAAFINNSSTFEALQVQNNGSGKIATFRNSGGIVSEVGNDGKIGVGTTVSAAFMTNVRGALPSFFTATSAATTPTYGGSVFARETGANGDGNGLAISMYDNATTMSEYGYIGSIIESNTNGSQSGAIVLAPSLSGSRTEQFRVGSGGNVTALGVYNATVGGTNRDVFVDNTGLIGYVSSFRASKKNIKPFTNTDWLHRLNPVTFNYRIKDKKGNYTDSAYNEIEYGLVAEEVETVNKEMVFYDVDSTGKKQLRGVHYSKLIIPLLAEVKEHKKKLDEQQTIIEALLTRIKALEVKLN